jgi:hypothetical protein
MTPRTHRPQQFPVARQSAGWAPLRRPGSVRRTTSIDSDWPEGFGAPWALTGRARDLLTPVEGAPRVLATGGFRILSSPRREILAIDGEPDHDRVQALVGLRAGGASRAALAERLGDRRGTPLYQLLDDFAGASLVAGWIWSQWRDDWMKREGSGDGQAAPAARSMVDVCTGFAAGAESLEQDGRPGGDQSSTAVLPLQNPDDPDGWHVMPDQHGPQMRRARRIDIWCEGGLLKVDAGFQDSGSDPSGGRTAIHEYRVFAEIEPVTGALVALQALPLVLPYRECPGASIKATRLIGKPVGDFRATVLETLPSTLGCTHLNDVLRALADVPALAAPLAAGAE